MKSGSTESRPPRLAKSLLARALPNDARDHVLGDLEEVFQRKLATDGVRSARTWYWREAISFAARFLRERRGGKVGKRSSDQNAEQESLREGRGSGGISWLDVKLGFRMLVKYPVLTLVGGMAITVAATIGVGGAEFMSDLLTPRIPLEDGDRVVRLGFKGEAPERLYDFVTWRNGVRSVTDLSVATQRSLGVVTANGTTGSVNAAQLSASSFVIARVAPQLGRVLTEADERPGAPPVVVLGWEPWQRLYDGDPAVLGQTVQLGGVPTTVVGVMPEGYGYPINHSAWVPFHVDEVSVVPGVGPSVLIAGRLAEGVSIEQANAELSAIGARMAADHPEIYQQVQAEVVAYGDFLGGGDPMIAFMLYGVRVLFIFLLVVACANVATLVFARTVSRESEIALRTALGATRRRIVFQLFAEALVLVGGATVLALVITSLSLRWASNLFFEVQEAAQVPFWWDDSLSPQTILFASVLALVGALMVGVVPALKATRGRLLTRLSQLSTGGGAGLRFGGMWTAVVVFQVALSVAFLPLAVQQGLVVVDNPLERSDFPADQYLTAELARDLATPIESLSPGDRDEALEVSRQLFEEVRSAVAAEPGVETIALADRMPGMNHPFEEIEVRGDGAAAPVGYEARQLAVDPDYLRMMGTTVVSGRGLLPSDFVAGGRNVVVNETFVTNAMGGTNVVGAQLRYPTRPGEEANVWYQIVGVVSDAEMDDFGPGAFSAVFAPLGGTLTTRMFVRLRPEAGPMAARLYAIVASVDASLRLDRLATVEDAWRPVHRGNRLFGWIFALVAAVTLVLSIAGIYAIMAFTVTQRTREIAIRRAVGASAARVIASVFTRAFAQLLLGVALGCSIAIPVMQDTLEEGPRTLLIVATLLLVSGLGSCLVPIRRALSIHPSQAIKTG